MHVWLAVALVPAGFATGWPAATATARYCGAPSRARRLAIAGVIAAVFGTLGWRFGATATLVAFLYLGVIGTLLAFIDVAVKRLPDRLTLPSYLVGAGLFALAVPLTDSGGARFVHALIGMAALWLLYGVQHFLAPDHIGRGDVKLAGVLGLYLGWLGKDSWLLGVILGFLLGGLVAGALLVTRRASRKTDMPFGPYMIMGALVAALAYGAIAS